MKHHGRPVCRRPWAIAGMVAVACIGLGSLYWYANRPLYGAALHDALRDKIKAGDTVTQVRAVLGPGRPHSERQLAKTLATYKRIAVGHPEMLPDGVEDHDQFVMYLMGPRAGGGMLLQFRNGRLVNHDPDTMGEYVPTAFTSLSQ